LALLAARGVPQPPHLRTGRAADMRARPVPVAARPRRARVLRGPAHWRGVEQGMVAVVNGPTGTARGLGDGFPYVIAGKTGTAERYSRTTEEWTHIMQVPIERHQVLFEAFTPAEDPRIAVIVVLEAGRTGGRDAAPIARAMLDAWLESGAAAEEGA